MRQTLLFRFFKSTPLLSLSHTPMAKLGPQEPQFPNFSGEAGIDSQGLAGGGAGGG
jgi:hypothetical protein